MTSALMVVGSCMFSVSSGGSEAAEGGEGGGLAVWVGGREVSTAGGTVCQCAAWAGARQGAAPATLIVAPLTAAAVAGRMAALHANEANHVARQASKTKLNRQKARRCQ